MVAPGRVRAPDPSSKPSCISVRLARIAFLSLKTIKIVEYSYFIKSKKILGTELQLAGCVYLDSAQSFV